MSRLITKGINPENNERVTIAYGYDIVHGFTPGYFFQVYNPHWLNGGDEEMLVDEGFTDGIKYETLMQLFDKWSVKHE